MNIRPIAVRVAIYLGVLGLTLMAAPIGLSLVAQFDSLAGLVSLVWAWEIMATLPMGIARTEFDGFVFFSDTGWILSLAFWLLTGLATAMALRWLKLAYFAPLSLLLVVIYGVIAHGLMYALGYAAYITV